MQMRITAVQSEKILESIVGKTVDEFSHHRADDTDSSIAGPGVPRVDVLYPSREFQPIRQTP